MIDYSAFLILNYLDIFKNARLEHLKVLELADFELQLILDDLIRRGLIKKSDDEISLSDLGEREIEKYRREILEGCARKDDFLNYCAAFEEINIRFKELVTRWQLREVGGELVLNDHSDPEYDMAILEELNRVHVETINLIERMSEIFPFLRGYIRRFEFALSRLMDGDLGYMADLDKQSYHTIWFELHETLLKMCGAKRIE